MLIDATPSLHRVLGRIGLLVLQFCFFSSKALPLSADPFALNYGRTDKNSWVFMHSNSLTHIVLSFHVAFKELF